MNNRSGLGMNLQWGRFKAHTIKHQKKRLQAPREEPYVSTGLTKVTDFDYNGALEPAYYSSRKKAGNAPCCSGCANGKIQYLLGLKRIRILLSTNK